MEKAKNDDKLKRGEDRFNPNVAFLVIVVCFGVMIFFRLDELIGAVGLWRFYGLAATASSVGFASLTLTLADRWLVPNPSWSQSILGQLSQTALSIIVATVCLTALILLFADIQTNYIDTTLFLAGVTFTSVIWIMSHQFGIKLHNAILKFATFIMLTFMISFSINVTGTFFRNDYLDSTYNEPHFYYLFRQPIWTSHENGAQPIILYQCNDVGIYCQLIQRFYVDAHEEHDIHVISDGTIYIVVDDEIVYQLGDEE